MKTKTQYRVGRNAEEERLHQMSCEYWRSPITRQRLGLPDNETIRRAVLHVDRRSGAKLEAAALRAANRMTRAERQALKRKVWVQQLPEENPMTPIARMVAESFGLPWENLFAGGRNQEVVLPRQAAMALLMERRKWSTSEVAAYFGKKDHGTVLFAIKAVRDRCATDAGYAAKLAAGRVQLDRMRSEDFKVVSAEKI